MNILLKFLIVKMETIDGRRGTAKKLIEHIGQNMHLQKTFTKYQILRFRQKISFIAFKHKKTIQELLLSQFLVSYHHFVKLGIFKYSKHNQCKDHDLYGSITDSCNMKGLFYQIMNHNKHVLKEQHSCVAHSLLENLKVLNTDQTLRLLKKDGEQ